MIRIRHFRKGHSHLFDTSVSTTGGCTIAIQRKLNAVHVGIATCSDKDTFCKQTGRDLAIARLSTSPLVIEERDLLAYFLRKVPSGMFSAEGYGSLVDNSTLATISDNVIYRYFYDMYLTK